MRIPFIKSPAEKPGILAAVRDKENYLFVHMSHRRSETEPPRVMAAFKLTFAEFASGGKGKLSLWKKTPATTLLNTEEYQILQLEAPRVPRAEWKSALQWSLQDHLDFPLASASFEALDIPVEPHMSGRRHMIYVIVAKNDIILSTMQSFDSAGLNLTAIDTPGLALRNISALLEIPEQGQACLYFDNDKGFLVITFRGELYDFRNINISLQQFAACDKEQEKQLFERINLELQRTFDALYRQYSFIHISRLSIVHRTELSGLPKYLKDNLDAPVDLLNLEGKLDMRDCPGLRNPARQARYLLAIGAALRGKQAAAEGKP